MGKKQGDISKRSVSDVRSIGLNLANDLVNVLPRMKAFWNYSPIPIFMRDGGYFRSKKTTKVIAGGNASTKTHVGIFEAIMVFTGKVPPSMQGIYAYEKELIALANSGRPRHVRIVVQDYAKHWNMTLKPKMLGSPNEEYCGLLPEEWSADWNEDSHIFTGPDGSQLDIFASDPAEQVDPRTLRGPRLDFCLIDELNTQTVYEECLSRVLGVKGGLGYVACTYCPQEGYECWSYDRFYKSAYNPATKKRLPEEECNHAIFYEKVTPMDNPSNTPEKIEAMKASVRQWEIAPRIYGEYSHRGDNPFFKVELLEKWEREGRTNQQGIYYEVEVEEADMEEGDFVGKLSAPIPPNDVLSIRNRDDAIIWQVWELPKIGHKYVLIADSSAGRADSDYNVGDLWDFTSMKRPVQVAQARLKQVKGIDFAVNCLCMANVYGNCLVVPESNAFGETFIETGKNYANMYVRTNLSDKSEREDIEKYGWNTNKYSKPAILENLHKLIVEWFADIDTDTKQSYCPIKSVHTLQELQSYEEKIQRSKIDNQIKRVFGARAGMYDDTVMTMAIGCWIGTKENDKLTVNTQKKVVEQKRKNLHAKLDKPQENDGRSSFARLRNSKYVKQNVTKLSLRNIIRT